MPVTRINNNQITDSSSGNVYLGVNAAAKVQDYSVTAGKIANNLVYGSDLTVTGNLTVQGNTTTIDTVNLVVEDPLILLAKEQTGSPTLDIGFIGKRGTSDNIAFVWDESLGEFATVFTSSENTNTVVTINSYASLKTLDANVLGNLSITGTSTFTGNITGANVTGNVNAGNFNTTGVVTATGNVTGGNLVTGGVVTATGNVSGGNVTTSGQMSATSTITGGNVATSGTVSATGTITGGNLETGGTVSATGTATVGNVATSGTVSATGTITGGNLATGGTVSATGTATVGNVTTSGNVSATGNVTGGNINTGGNVSATGNVNAVGFTGGNASVTGNVYAANFIGNISGNIDAGGSNTQVQFNDDDVLNGSANFTFDQSTNVMSVTGTIQGTTVSATGNVIGGNVTTAGLVTATGNVTGGNINTGGVASVTGNVNSGNVNTTIVSATGNVIGANVSTSGLVTATGNVTGGNINTGGLVSATGNVDSGNVNTTIVSATGNVIGANVTTGGLVTATGNVTGGNLVTGGLATVTGNVIGGNISTAGLVTATGNVTGGNVTTSGQVSATGNVTGNNFSAGGFVSAVGNVIAPTIVTTTVTTSSGDLTLNSAGGALQWDGSGNIVMNSQWINNLSDPTQAQDAATKQYVDDAVSTGITIHTPVYLEAPVALPAATYAQGGTTATVTDTIAGNTVVFSTAVNPQVNDQLWFTSSFNGIVANTAYFVVSAPNTSAAVLSTTYDGAPVTNISNATGLTQAVRINSGVGATLTGNTNAALTVDGVAVAVSNRILVYNQTPAYENGVYVVTDTGNVSAPYILTRSSDTNKYGPKSTTELDAGDYFYVQSGDTGAGESYVMTAPTGAFIIGYNSLTFTQFSASQVYTANTAAGLVLNGTIFSAKVDNDTTAFDGGGNISVKAGANLTTPNIGAATGTSLSLTGNVTGGNLVTGGLISATGNITGGNLISGNAVIGNVQVTGDITVNSITSNTYVSAIGNVVGGNVTTGGLVTATGNVTGGNILTGGLLSATGNITSGTNVVATANVIGGNISTAGVVTATGNITGGNLITGGYVSATGNVDSGNVNSGIISGSGNVTGANFNTTGLVTATGNVTGGNLITSGLATITGTVTAGNVVTGGTVSATGNITGGNINTGIVSATGNVVGTGAVFSGNITAANFIGNISGNIDAGGSNTQVQFNDDDLLNGSANFTFDKATDVMSVTGTIQGTTVSATGNVIGGNVTTAGLVTATGNVTGGNLVTGGLATVTGNVIGGNISTAGLVTATGNVTSGNLNTGGLASVTGNVIGGNISTAGLVTATGNVTGGNVTTGGLITATGNITGANLILTTGIVDGPAAGRIDINGSGLDTDFAVSGDTTANILYIDAGTGTASFGSSAQTTNAIVAFNATNSILMPVGSTLQRPGTGVIGMLRFNSTGDSLEVYTSGGWEDVGVPAFTVITADSFSGNGSQTVFTLSQDSTTAATIVSINGVVQIPTTAYSVSGNTLTFTEAPTVSDKIDARLLTTTTTVTAIDNTSGNAIVQALDTADTIQITGNLLPAANVTYDLGSNTRSWRNGYFSGTTIFLGNLQLKQADASTFAVYTSDGVTQANIDVGSVDVSSIISGTTVIGIGAPNGNAYLAPAGSNVLVAASTGVYVTGVMSATGNVTGNYILGNGSLLTGIITSVANINNGTSNVRIDTSGGNIAANVGGTANVIVLSTAGANIEGTLGVTGNITGGNISATNHTGTTVSVSGTVTSASVVGGVITGTSSSVSGTVTGASVVGGVMTGTSVSVSGTVTGASVVGGVMTGTSVSVSGAVTGASVVGGVMTGTSVSVSGAVTGGAITGSSLNITTGTANVGSITNANANGVGNIGNSTVYFNTIFAKATSAQYADLAEMYEADRIIEPGTVVCFGGNREIKICDEDACRRVAGVVSTNPSYIMNAGLTGDHVIPVALTGRVPTRVTGTIRKGDMLVSTNDGRARADADPAVGAVIGKALADFDGADGTIEVVVGRL